MLCQYCPDDAMPYSYSDWMLTDKPMSFGLIPGWANPTGIILIIVLTVMVICSMPFVRRGGFFEIFYFSHLVSPLSLFSVCTVILNDHSVPALLGVLGIPHPARARVLEVDRLPRNHIPPGAARPAAAVLHGQGQDHNLRRRHTPLQSHATHHQEAAQLQLCPRRLGLRQDSCYRQEVRVKG